MRDNRWVLFALVFALGVALVSPLASPNPDGLNRVAEDYNFQQSEIPSWTRQLPFYSLFEGYALRSVSDPALAKSVAGFLGTLVVLGGTWGLGVYLRARNRKP
ncbi:PDGLE domain-containing protein [Candidatus Cyanaurora vandensis]|uniref:PDGLE domain-containing protein n=1 Tax=Candidatus Cyanaurora vandensis TaxID=2714958 RepID=UPI00257DA3A0|nr:PDGLE domain-containing protein [Candidatus Cyanaurora vandensis]